jgi:hypothetical protein
MSIIHKTEFWTKAEQTLSLLGGKGAKIIFIWIDDKDNNGTIDWFE